MQKLRYVIIAYVLSISSIADANTIESKNDNKLSLSDIISCSSIEEPKERLFCFDKTVNTLKHSAASGDILIINREDINNIKKSTFGFSLPKISIFMDKDGKGGEKELTSIVKNVHRSGYSTWVMTLEDGSIWQTTEVDHAFDPKIGGDIRIHQGAMGGYLANLNGARAVRVRRIG